MTQVASTGAIFRNQRPGSNIISSYEQRVVPGASISETCRMSRRSIAATRPTVFLFIKTYSARSEFTTLLYMDNCYEKYFVVAIRSIFVNDKHLATIENT